MLLWLHHAAGLRAVVDSDVRVGGAVGSDVHCTESGASISAQQCNVILPASQLHQSPSQHPAAELEHFCLPDWSSMSQRVKLLLQVEKAGSAVSCGPGCGGIHTWIRQHNLRGLSLG
jgi:hypothetical protein